MTAKELNKLKMLEYWGNPDNEFLTRSNMATQVLGYSKAETLWRFFTPDELTEIEAEALAIRRSKYSSSIAIGDTAMLREMAKGNVQAARLVYQRFEDWAPRQRTEVTGKDGGPLQIDIAWPENGTLDDENT